MAFFSVISHAPSLSCMARSLASSRYLSSRFFKSSVISYSPFSAASIAFAMHVVQIKR